MRRNKRLRSTLVFLRFVLYCIKMRCLLIQRTDSFLLRSFRSRCIREQSGITGNRD